MKTKTSFASDNLSVDCGEIKEYLGDIRGQYLPYGDDEYCVRGAAQIKRAFGVPEADVHFVPNGRMANMLGCMAMLHTPPEAIISPDDGHLLVHERKTMKWIGRRVLSATTVDGKLNAEAVERTVATCRDGLRPRALYLAQATDRGLAYTKNELAALVECARQNGMYSFADGARLAVALARKGGDLSLADFGGLGLDMFWVGGTKNGGLNSEAVVVLNEELKDGFRDRMEAMGALIPKSWAAGAQFERFFTPENNGDLLWLRLARHANALAAAIREGLRGVEGVSLQFEGDGTGTNMLFPVLPKRVLERLQEDFHFFTPFGKVADTSKARVRLVCSWDTKPSAVVDLVEKARRYTSEL